MALTVTNNVAILNGQQSLTRTNNNLPKAIERPTPEVQSEPVKTQNEVVKKPNVAPAPDVKINFSAQGREAALASATPVAKNAEKLQVNNVKQEPVETKLNAADKAADTKLQRAEASDVQRAETKESASVKKQAKADLQTAINETKKAVKQVKSGDGALKEINDVLVKVRDRVQEIAKNGTTDKGTQVLNQKEITNALKKIDNIVKSAQLSNQKLADKPTGKVTNAPDQTAKSLTNVTPKSVTPEVKAVSANTKVSKAAASTLAQTATDTATPADTPPTTALSKTQTVNKIVPVAAQAAAQASNVRQNVLAQSGLSENIGKAERRPAVAVSQLLATVSAPSQSLAAQPAEAVETSNTTNNNPANQKSEESVKDAEAKNRSLFFQGRTSADQIAKLLLDQVRDNALADGAEDVFSGLYKIDVSNQGSAQDSLQILERVIRDTAVLRSQFGAFQAETLARNAESLRANLGHSIGAEPTIRDTDFATEIAAFTKKQVLLQAGKTVLGNANQSSQLIADLLKS